MCSVSPRALRSETGPFGGDSALRLAGRSEPVLVWRASRAAGAGPPITRRACPQRKGRAMRVRAVIASAASAALALVGLAAPASAIASPYDTVTVSSMNNLVTAMESYALFDGNDLYTGVTATALSDWGWTPGSSTAVSYTHLRAHETKANLVCRLLLEK